jgi:surfeit locus 1 family protein
VRIAVGSRVFAPSPVATLLLGAALAGLVALGLWQLRRADEKRALWAAFERGDTPAVALATAPGAAVPPRYARVAVAGHYLPERQFLLDNMTHAGQVGYRVLTPLAADDGGTVLVDRGWVPLGASRAQLPDVAVGPEPRRVSGRLDDPPRAGIALDAGVTSGWPRVLSYPSHATLEAAYGAPLYPRIVLLDADAADGFVREWRPGGFGPERHLGYALQWFALAATLFIGYVFASLRPAAGDPP